MARLSDLVEIVALVTGLPPNNVGLHARLAREAGYISQGGRGLSAPEMTPRDAAALLGALVASPTAKETASTLTRITRKSSEVGALDILPFLMAADGFLEPHENDEGPEVPQDPAREKRRAVLRKKFMDRHTVRKVVLVRSAGEEQEEEHLLPKSLSFLGQRHSFVEMIESLISFGNGVTLSSALEVEHPIPTKLIIGSNVRPFFDLYYPTASSGRGSAVSVRYDPVTDQPEDMKDFKTVRYITARTIDAVIVALNN